MAKFNKMRFASVVVILAIINITLFAIVDIILFVSVGREPTEIMPYFFGFWGCEIVVLAAKRIFVRDDQIEKKNGTITNVSKTESKG